VHTSQKAVPTARSQHAQESLLTHLAKGREWATPGIEAALHRALTRLDSGREAASPRIQARLRTIADELAAGAGAVTPRLHKRITRIAPKATPPAPNPGAKLARPEQSSRKTWWIAGLVAAAALYGATLWRLRHPAWETPAPSPQEQTADSATIRDDPAATQSAI
jgi:hypothetical protein